MKEAADGRLWVQWVLANSFAELVGLGSTFAVGFGLFAGFSEVPGILPAVLSGLLMTSSGLIEGAVVGLSQWWVMSRAFPELLRRSWVLATIVGAVMAWFLGSMTMMLASVFASGQDQTAQEPEASLMVLATAGMGLVAGLVLAFPQWRVLRHSVRGAWLWMPANSLAWAAGMPIVFAAVDRAVASTSVAAGVAGMALLLAVTGAVVGAVHGVALVKLSHQERAGPG